ncbi:hypothetical protein F0562_015307 [Nyssa sinensis]|uniref:Uncharacterized protein n=1 Tax=Nyssa sinensis TaxID=561372 RepID=A0A5J4ZJX1_9ASTE|nr:hypothetical protein F0562_015307 [Nyssa sinensis]
MEAQGAIESVFSPGILNPNISNVHGCHDLSALLLESRLDDISEGVEGAAWEDALIHDPFSAHSWADREEEGEFIPQVALDPEAEFGGFFGRLIFLNGIFPWIFHLLQVLEEEATSTMAAMEDVEVEGEIFLFGSDNHFTDESINGSSNVGGSRKAEWRTRSKPRNGHKAYPSVQQQSRFLVAQIVNVQHFTPLVAIQVHTQSADTSGGGAIPHTPIASVLGPKGDGPLVNPPQIRPAIGSQVNNFASSSKTVGQNREGTHSNPYAVHGKAKGHALLTTDNTYCAVTVNAHFEHASFSIKHG